MTKKVLAFLCTACMAMLAVGEDLWLGCVDSQAVAIDSGSGRMTHWMVEGEDVLDGEGGVLSLEDAVTGETDAPMAIKVVRLPDDSIKVESLSSSLNLHVVAIYSLQESGAIFMDCNVTDIAQKDRAVTVSFSAMLKPGPWGYGNTWMADRLQVERLTPGLWANQVDPFGGQAPSQTPLGCVDNGRVNVSFANSMRNPRFFSYSGHGLQNGGAVLLASVNLGMAAETLNFPHQADFQLALLSNRGDTGVRGAFEAYYRAFPECFAYRSPQGGWALWVGGEETLAAARECGMAYDQWEFDLGAGVESISQIQKAGLSAMAYSEPWGVWHPINPAWLKQNWNAEAPKPAFSNNFFSPIDTEAFKSELAKDLGDETPSDRFPCVTRDFIVRTLMNSAITGNHGEWIFHAYSLNGKSFPWTPNQERKEWASGIIIVNSSPFLPHPNRYDLQLAQVECTANRLMEAGLPNLDGVYLDSLVFYLAWDAYNFNREHWKTTTVPLTFAKVDGKAMPAMHNALANSEFLAEFRRYCDRHGYFDFVNTWHPVTQFSIGFVDTLGAGEHSGPGLQNAADLRAFRFLAKNKPISTCDYRLMEPEVTPEEIETRCNLALMYGIQPGASNGWGRPAAIEKMRQVMPKYAAMQKTLAAAGWEVMTKAVIDNGGLIERWGDSTRDGLFFTVRNNGDEDTTMTVTIPEREFPGVAFDGACELLDGTPVDFTQTDAGWSIVLEIPARRTLVLKLQGE